MTMMPKKACAMACSSRGNVSKRMACALASRPPPASPCSVRAMTSITKDVAMPHIMDATVNPTSEKMKYAFLPKRWPSRAERSLDVGESDVHDARVDDLEQRADGHGDRDRPLVDGLRGRGRNRVG